MHNVNSFKYYLLLDKGNHQQNSEAVFFSPCGFKAKNLAVIDAYKIEEKYHAIETLSIQIHYSIRVGNKNKH